MCSIGRSHSVVPCWHQVLRWMYLQAWHMFCCSVEFSWLCSYVFSYGWLVWKLIMVDWLVSGSLSVHQSISWVLPMQNSLMYCLVSRWTVPLMCSYTDGHCISHFPLPHWYQHLTMHLEEQCERALVQDWSDWTGLSLCVLYEVAVQPHKCHGLGGLKELVSAMHYGIEAVVSVVESFLHVSAVTVYSMGGTLTTTCL